MTYTLPPADPRAPAVDRVTDRHALTRLRHRAGISQRHLAELLGTTTDTVSRLERGTAVLDTRWSSHLTLLFGYILKQEGEE